MYIFFFFNDTATTEIYTLSLHDALPIWINRRVTHGRRIALCEVIGIVQCGWIRVGSGQYTYQCEVVKVHEITTNQRTNEQWENCYQHAIAQPYQALLADNGREELMSRAQTHAGKEDTNTDFTNHKVSTDGRIGHQVVLRTKPTDEQSHDKRASRQAKFERFRYSRNDDR